MAAPTSSIALGPMVVFVLIAWILPASCSTTEGHGRLRSVRNYSDFDALHSSLTHFKEFPTEHQRSSLQGVHLGLLNIAEADHAEPHRSLDIKIPKSDPERIPVAVDTFTVWYWLMATAVVGCFASIVLWLNVQRDPTPRGDPNDPTSEVKVVIDLPHNMYALTLVTALRQATTHGFEIPAPMAWVIVISMGFLQLFVVFLIVHDIDPQALPVTSEAPGSPWIKTFYTVHCMKWIMVTVLICHMVGEISQCTCVWEASFQVNKRRLSEPRCFILIALTIQYIVTLGIIWGGVSAVLSLQDVPNIVYSSLAITFIGTIDERLFDFLQQILDIEAEFKVTLSGFYGVASTSQGPPKDDLELPIWYPLTLKIVQIYPMLLGFALIGRAWYTNIMPTDRIHALLDILHLH